jgi:hypothetical protein
MSWAGVTARPHRFGGTAYRFGTREIGQGECSLIVSLRVSNQEIDERDR